MNEPVLQQVVIWLVVLTVVAGLNLVAMLVHHTLEVRREAEREERTEALLAGFRQMEHVLRGAIAQRIGIEQDLQHHGSTIDRIVRHLERHDPRWVKD